MVSVVRFDAEGQWPYTCYEPNQVRNRANGWGVEDRGNLQQELMRKIIRI